MQPSTRRYLLIIGLLLAGLALSLGQRWSSAARVTADLPTPAAGAEADQPAPDYVYFVDIEGWYRITPYETVVRSPYDLTAETTAEMAQALPPTLGHWQQVGEDEFIADDPAVVFYLGHPTIAMQRVYQDPSGQRVTLVLIGNKGEDSFLLFSHTPETCYPGRLWNVVESRQESALLDDRPMYVQYLLTEHAPTGNRLLVLFWYLWDDPERDSAEGVLSMRVNLFLPADQTEEEALERAWDFVRTLFPATVPWERF